MSDEQSAVEIDGQAFEVIKPTRLREGMVIKRGDVYGRVGPKQPTLEEQIHTESLFNRGFPVSEVLASGDIADGQWYFTEKSLGDKTFHEMFCNEFQQNGQVSAETFDTYLAVIDEYARAQVKTANRSDVSPQDFVERLIPDAMVCPSYMYFEYDLVEYHHAIQLATDRLQGAAMGILQFDLNPYNILEGGVIDFELVGYGPIGFDGLMSARWGTCWFTDYPSQYPCSYKLSEEQIAKSDSIIDKIAASNNLEAPTDYLQEFLLLKSAWGLAEDDPPKNDWPADKLAFRHYRTNVLHRAVQDYLAGQEIHYLSFSSIPGGELLK